MTGWCAPLPAPPVWSLWMLHFCPPTKPTELNHFNHTNTALAIFGIIPPKGRGQVRMISPSTRGQYRSALLGCPAGQGNLQEPHEWDYLHHPDNPDHSAVPPLYTGKQKTVFLKKSTQTDGRGKMQLVFSPTFSLCVMHWGVTLSFFLLSLLFPVRACQTFSWEKKNEMCLHLNYK